MVISITLPPLILIRPTQSLIQRKFRSLRIRGDQVSQLRILLSSLTSRSLMLTAEVQRQPSPLLVNSSPTTSSSPTTVIQPSPASPSLTHSLAPTSLSAPWHQASLPPSQLRPTPPHSKTSTPTAVVMVILITPQQLILIRPTQPLTQKTFQLFRLQETYLILLSLLKSRSLM